MIGKGPRVADGKRYVVILMDFNTPNARDALVVGKVAKAVQNLTVTQGANQCVVLAIMATRAKEDTNDDPMDDEKKLSDEMRKAGFGFQQRIRMALSPPNEDQISAANWDFWQDGRLMYQCKDEKDAIGNFWFHGSELARTTRVHGVLTTISNAEVVNITDATEEIPDKSVTPKIRAAQRGVEANGIIIQQLMMKSRLQNRALWLNENDIVDFVEVHPHNGDRTVALVKMMKQGSCPCGMRNFLASGYKRSPIFIQYSLASKQQQLMVCVV